MSANHIFSEYNYTFPVSSLIHSSYEIYGYREHSLLADHARRKNRVTNPPCVRGRSSNASPAFEGASLGPVVLAPNVEHEDAGDEEKGHHEHGDGPTEKGGGL